MSLLSVKNLTHTYSGNTPFIHDAVHDVSFDIERGEIVGIIGHTGSGKSTLVQHLNGLLKPTQGKILLDGKDIWEDPKKIKSVRSKVGLVFQYPEYQLFEETVREDIAFGPKNLGLEGEELDNRINEICSIVKIPKDFYELSPFDLSGGEKRRVAIAGVMAMKPEIIIFDEPIAGLDPMGRQNVISMIADYRKEYNATVIIISHNMEDMAMLTDKLLVLDKGRLVMFDKTDKVFSNGDMLRKIGLNVPIVTLVMDEIRSRGIDISKDLFTVEDCVNALKALSKGGEGNA